MKFEIREFTGATGATVDGECERSLGEVYTVLASFDAPYPAAARKTAVTTLGDLGFNSANYVNVVESGVCCTWHVTDARLIALVPVVVE